MIRIERQKGHEVVRKDTGTESQEGSQEGSGRDEGAVSEE